MGQKAVIKLRANAEEFLFMTPKLASIDAPFWKKFKTPMKKIVYLPFVIFAIAVIALVWFFANVSPVSTQANFINFNVPTGANATQIGNTLYKQSLIKNPLAFKVYVQFSGVSNSIQAGDYRLSPSLNLFQIVSTLSKSPLEVRVTIPEGLRREEIAAKFAKSLDQNSSFMTEFLDQSKGMEGSLFPDTYSISNNATPGAIIAKMEANFHTKVDSLTPSDTNLSKSQLLVLASLIERETKLGDERPVVAGILLNRLNSGWPLQIDATVQYAVATSKCKTTNLSCSWWEPLGSGDLSINSPFNTYKNVGLPPSPIANPGLTAIKAAYNPEKSGYFYYIHDKEGQIHYASTLEEQDSNINKYLR